jgi:hypothetical protein
MIFFVFHLTLATQDTRLFLHNFLSVFRWSYYADTWLIVLVRHTDNVMQEYGWSLLPFLTLYWYAVAEISGQIDTESKMMSLSTRRRENNMLSFLLC